MLAQSFLSPADLGLSDAQFDALRKTLVLLETGRLVHVTQFEYSNRKEKFSGHFNMSSWSDSADCGTVCCIAGTAEMIGNLGALALYRAAVERPAMFSLFFPPVEVCRPAITPSQAAVALRSYLTTGEPNWEAALS